MNDQLRQAIQQQPERIEVGEVRAGSAPEQLGKNPWRHESDWD